MTPILRSASPGDGATDVQPAAGIDLEVGSDAAVSLADIRLWVRGAQVWNGAAFASGWTSSFHTATVLGRRFMLVPPDSGRWSAGEQVVVRVRFTDADAALYDGQWSFTALDLAPQPFSVWRMLPRAIREQDPQGILETYCAGIDAAWRGALHGRITALPDLLDAQKAPAEWLAWLLGICGLGRDQSVEVATTEGMRRLLSWLPDMWRRKPDPESLACAVRGVVGGRHLIYDWHHLRAQADWSMVMEERRGRDANGLDFFNPWIGGSRLHLSTTSDAYPEGWKFWIDDLPGGTFGAPHQWQWLEIRRFDAASSLVGLYRVERVERGATWGIISGASFGTYPLAGNYAEWRLHGGNAEWVTEVRLVDEPGSDTREVDRALLDRIANYLRPVGERIDVIYLLALDTFETEHDLDYWAAVGTATWDAPGQLRLADGTWLLDLFPGSTAWTNYATAWRLRTDDAATVVRILVRVAGVDRYEVVVRWPDQLVRLRRIEGGVETLLDDAAAPSLLPGIESVVRVSVVTGRPGGAYAYYGGYEIQIRVHVDGDLLIDYLDSSTLLSGGVAVGAENGEAVLSLVEVMAVPGDVQRIGPQP